MARIVKQPPKPNMAAIPARAAENEEPEDNTPDLDAEFDALDDGSDDLADELNNPDIVHLGDAPSVGGRTRSGVDLFGEQADYVAGRVTSPKLYAQAAQFPTCAQLRVWKWENGIPVGLGTIDSTATEEEFVSRFITAMPKKGEARAQFKLRPIDMRGQELGQEVTIVISEHHAAVRAVREAEEEERERGSNPYAYMPPPSNDMSSEMSRMVEHMLATAETRSKALEEALEAERERIRQEELRRTQERVDLATNAAQGVQVITERMMKDEAQRAERAARMQSEQSQLLITTLTSIFAQQQSMAQQAAEAARRADEYRIEQERQRADRERIAAEERRKLEMQEAEYRRQREREEADYRLRLEREESERKRIESERLVEQRRAELELRLAREREETEARRRADELKLQHEREDAQRRFEAARMELELKLNREREEMERKERRERDEAERRERWFAEERSRREAREAQEARERDQERQRQHERMVKELELQAQKDREHAERMIALQKAETNANNGDVLANAAKLFGQFGVPPDQIFKRLFTPEAAGDADEDGDDDKGGWMDVVGKVLPVIGEVARAAANRNAGPQPGPQPQAGPRNEISPEQMAELQRQQAPRRPAGPRMLPNNVPDQIAMPRPRDRERERVRERKQEQDMVETVERAVAESAQAPIQPSAPVVLPGIDSEIPSPPQGIIVPNEPPVVEPAPASAPEPEYDGSEAPQPPAQDGQIPVTLSDLAAAKNLPLKAQKAARVGIRKLVKKLENEDEAKWEEIIGTAVATEVNIYHYVDAVSVHAAIREGGASPELTARIIAAMRRSSLIPEGFNYGGEE